MQPSFVFSLLITLLFLVPANATLTHWIHSSCTEDKMMHPPDPNTPAAPPNLTSRWTALINEVKASAASGFNRIRNGNDKEYARFFNYMFDTNRRQDDPIDTPQDPRRKVKGQKVR
jgi:hypothetical protein